MQRIRSSLTRLKNKIEEVIPEGSDVFGYPGIDRKSLIEFVDGAYALTNRIEDLRGQFAIVVLKRSLAPLLDDCKDFLDNKIEGKKAAESFDRFLRSLTQIHNEIYLTYTIYCSEAIRTEAELEKVIKNVKSSQEFFDSIKPEWDQIIVDLERIETVRSSIDEANEEVSEKLSEIIKGHGQVKTLVSESTAQSQIMNGVSEWGQSSQFEWGHEWGV